MRDCVFISEIRSIILPLFVFHSHDLIGVFTTSIRELNQGPGPQNNYEVSYYEGFIIDVLRYSPAEQHYVRPHYVDSSLVSDR